MDLVEVLSFLFMLSTMELGRVSSVIFSMFHVCNWMILLAGILDGEPISNTKGDAGRSKRLWADLAEKGP